MEAPEPLIHAIDALEQLRPGCYLRLIHRMAPCKLYRYMELQGIDQTTRTGPSGDCELFAWRHDDQSAAEQARWAYQQLPDWPV